jgi:hypothetical protein
VRQTADEGILIEGGAADKGENLAGGRFYGNRRAGDTFKQFFGLFLKVRVDGQKNVVTGGSRNGVQDLDDLAGGVDFDLAAAAFAPQVIIEDLFDAGRCSTRGG